MLLRKFSWNSFLPMIYRVKDTNSSMAVYLSFQLSTILNIRCCNDLVISMVTVRFIFLTLYYFVLAFACRFSYIY